MKYLVSRIDSTFKNVKKWGKLHKEPDKGIFIYIKISHNILGLHTREFHKSGKNSSFMSHENESVVMSTNFVTTQMLGI